MTRIVALIALAALSVACQPDFVEPWRLKDPRVMGGRIEIAGDTGARSRPKPGETFDIRMFLGMPGESKTALDARFDATLDLCFGVLLSNGTLACGAIDGAPASIPFAGAPRIVSGDELRFEGLSVPSQIADLPPPFDEIDRIALFGAVCVEGKVERVEGKQVNVDPVSELYRCIDNDKAIYTDPLVFTLSVLIDRGKLGDDNLSPSFACAENAADTDACKAGVKVDGENLLPGSFVLVRPKEGTKDRDSVALEPVTAGTDLPWTNCKDSGLPQVRVGDDEYTLRVRFDAADREVYPFEEERYGKIVRGEEREELKVSHALTDLGGDLARYFSIIENDVPDDEAELELAYTPPKADDDEATQNLGAGGRLVRIYFTLRDERGGVDYTTRELCLLPEAGD